MFMEILQALFWILGILVAIITIIEKLTDNEKSNSALLLQEIGVITYVFKT